MHVLKRFLNLRRTFVYQTSRLTSNKVSPVQKIVATIDTLANQMPLENLF